MSWVEWVAIAVPASCVVGLVAYVTWWVIGLELRWKKLPTDYLHVKYRPNVETQAVDTENLEACLRNACYQLNLYGPYKEDYVFSTMESAKILIQPTDAYYNTSHQLVAGEAFVEENTIAVGPRFIALAHEIAHLMEFRKSGTIDYLHSTWADNGFFKAQDAYSEWLKSRP